MALCTTSHSTFIASNRTAATAGSRLQHVAPVQQRFGSPRSALGMPQTSWGLQYQACTAVWYDMHVCRVDDCTTRCDPNQPDGPDASCQVSQAVIAAVGNNTHTACQLAETIVFHGLMVWRFLVFLALWWPLQMVGHVLARLIAAIVSANFVNNNVRNLVFSRACHCTHIHISGHMSSTVHTLGMPYVTSDVCMLEMHVLSSIVLAHALGILWHPLVRQE